MKIGRNGYTKHGKNHGMRKVLFRQKTSQIHQEMTGWSYRLLKECTMFHGVTLLFRELMVSCILASLISLTGLTKKYKSASTNGGGLHSATAAIIAENATKLMRGGCC